MKSNRFRRGFTLIELMVTVVVLAILSVVAVVSYSKYVKKARIQDVITFLSDIKMKQETYFQQFGHYVDTSSAAASYTNSDFYPSGIAGGDVEWEIECPDDQATYPGWCALGARPGKDRVDYQYVTVGWQNGDPDPPADIIEDPDRRWWFAVAQGDLDENGIFSEFILTSEHPEVMMFNEME